MRFNWLAGLLAALLWWPMTGGAGPAADWAALDQASQELAELESQLRLGEAAIAALREIQPTAAVTAARRELTTAEQAVESARQQDGLVDLHGRLQAARTARDAKVEALAAGAASFQAAQTRLAELQKSIAALETRASRLTADELLELARRQADQRQLSKKLNGAIRAWWRRGEVAQEHQAADALYQEYQTKSAKAGNLRAAEERVKTARQRLAETLAAVEVSGPAAEVLGARQGALTAKIAGLKQRVGQLETELLAGSRTVSRNVSRIDRKTNKEVTRTLTLWLPPGDYVRGVILTHPMLKGLASAPPLRWAAARAGLAMMVYDNFLPDIPKSLEAIDQMLGEFGAQSNHPELKGAPLLVGGLSASVLATRNIACHFPERVFGVVHVAGGNLQEMPEDGRGMVQVPFLAMNGEFEWCGPAGGGHASGKAGIRGEYGNQTQWVMIREQMLRLWRERHQHRLSLVVVPNADHGAWDVELAALFVRKAAQYRIPAQKRDGTQPAVCRPLPVEQGWLTDADLDHPRFAPAPFGAYQGDKNNAFWHFDEEMARAVTAYHQGQFILPDPTKQHPVPADWPKGKN